MQVVRRIHWRDVLTFLFFVLLATGLWYGHAMQSVRNATISVRLSYTGIPEEIGLQGKGLPTALRVEVRDAGMRLRSYQANPLHLSIDLASQVKDNEGTIRISSDVLRRSVTDMLQGTSKLVQVTPEEIVCNYYRQQERVVPVVWEGVLTPAAEYQLVGTPELLQKSVRIYGQKEQIAGVKQIATDTAVLTQIKDTVLQRLALHAPKGIRLATDSVTLQVISERFTEKMFRLPLQVEGVPANEHIRLFPHEVEATIRVGISHFAEVNERDVRVYCTYPANSKAEKLGVHIRYSNPYITNARVYPNEVEFIIEKPSNEKEKK